MTLIRADDDPLGRVQLEAELERELERESGTESVVAVRCRLVDTDVAVAEFRDFDCAVSFANGARSTVDVRSVGEEWTITSR